ncbi:hypothetical protein ZEAMMB73_Zm00001d005710 [Zea mays]|uniref:Uncharacterized protein n=1 Tax=Zea mays TaxID=4577 RepID=A0A1D6EPK1_MAIZE|nr:hypothetical protein ZEAMMB73_Zm00001d005710 [Zea mays]
MMEQQGLFAKASSFREERGKTSRIATSTGDI